MYYQNLVYNTLIEGTGRDILSTIGKQTNKVIHSGLKRSGKINTWLHKKAKENATEGDIVYKGFKHASNITKKGTKYFGKLNRAAQTNPTVSGAITVGAGIYGSGKIGARLARRRDRKALRTYR